MRYQLRPRSLWIKSGVRKTLLVSFPELKFVFTPYLNYWMRNYFLCLSQSAILFFRMEPIKSTECFMHLGLFGSSLILVWYLYFFYYFLIPFLSVFPFSSSSIPQTQSNLLQLLKGGLHTHRSASIIIKHWEIVKFIGHEALHSNI